MAKPTPKTIDPSQVTELALATIKDAKFTQLATIDGDQPRVRPVSPLRTEGFTVNVPNRVNYMQEWALKYVDVPLQEN